MPTPTKDFSRLPVPGTFLRAKNRQPIPTLPGKCARTSALVTLFVAVASLTGCAHTSTYNAAYLAAARRPPAQVVPGKAVIVTTQAEDDYAFTGPPTSLTGSATSLTVPLGAIAKEATVAAFADRLKGGAKAGREIDPTAGDTIVVTPKVTRYSYEYNQLKNVGFAITPTVQVTMQVRVLNPDGSTKSEKFYDSGTVEAKAYMLNTQPGEEINKLTHKAIYDLAAKAADETIAALETSTAATAK